MGLDMPVDGGRIAEGRCHRRGIPGLANHRLERRRCWRSLGNLLDRRLALHGDLLASIDSMRFTCGMVWRQRGLGLEVLRH
jgi:hypothetical protein